MVKKFSQFVKDSRGRPKSIPISYLGKGTPQDHELDKLVSEWNEKNFQTKLPFKKSDVKEDFSLGGSGEKAHESEVSIPHYHYPKITLRHERFEADEHIDYHAADELYKNLGHHYNIDENYKESHRQHIKRYTEGSGEFNRYLIGRHTGALNPQSHHDEKHHALMSAAVRVPTPHEMHLYAGVGSAHPGKHPETYLPAWSSMSTGAGTAQGFARHDSSLGTTMDQPHVIHNKKTKETAVVHPDVQKELKKKGSYFMDGWEEKKHAHEAMFGTPLKEEDYHRVDVSPVRHLIKARVAKGSHLVYVGHAGSADFHDEKELIAPAGSILRHNPEHTPVLHGNGILLHHTILQTPNELALKYHAYKNKDIHPDQMGFKF